MNIQKILDRVHENAEEKRLNTKQTRFISDLEYYHTCELIGFYNLGRKGILPSEWEETSNEIKQEDSEYKNYLRLKKKFETD